MGPGFSPLPLLCSFLFDCSGAGFGAGMVTGELVPIGFGVGVEYRGVCGSIGFLCSGIGGVY